jgi:hypothetical protein
LTKIHSGVNLNIDDAERCKATTPGARSQGDIVDPTGPIADPYRRNDGTRHIDRLNVKE